MIKSFVDVASTWGLSLTISVQKTKGIGVDTEPGCIGGVLVYDQSVEMVRVSVPWELNF